MTGWGHGHGVIMDKHYRFVKSIEPPGSYQASSDMHEFYVLPGGKTALMTQYLRSVHNLCQYDLCYGLAYIQQGAFQEVDIETGESLFSWRSLDHVDIDESYVLPASTEISGSGAIQSSPWDYFHINSVDKNADGDYLISARHVSAIYKISGEDGHVIWRLNGARSDYRLADFNFGFQHDARFVVDNEKETIITIFDNASNGYNQTERHSSGIKVRLDHYSKVAYLVQKYEPPITAQGGQHVSKSQGNYQELADGNVILGWGNDAFWTEYTPMGEIVFYGHIGVRNTMNYRVHKFNNWVGLPMTKPALWTYSKTGDYSDPMWAYASWNGATEIRSWRFSFGNNRGGPWDTLPPVGKTGFETAVRYDATAKYTFAEALDADGERLGVSEIQEIYVPDEELRSFCDELACSFHPDGDELQKLRDEHAGTETSPSPPVPNETAKEEKEDVEGQQHLTKVILIVALSGIGGIILVIAMFSLRNYVSPSVGRIRLRLADLIAGQPRGTYKVLAADEDRWEESVPMSRNME